MTTTIRSRGTRHRVSCDVVASALCRCPAAPPRTARTRCSVAVPFGQNQDLRFRWRAGSEPTAVIKTAIKAAAADANDEPRLEGRDVHLRRERRQPDRLRRRGDLRRQRPRLLHPRRPDGFTMWLREQGHVFDWGTLKWCQAYTTPPNGCYDAETIALDEFGHVEGLGHHANYTDDSDYGDAVVQTYSRTKPTAGWNMHVFGRCDVATLQTRTT